MAAKRAKRKRRIGEVNCRCSKYPFVHRMLGGACKGGAFVEATFEREMYGDCRDCPLIARDDEGVTRCQVLDGAEPALQCPALIEHVRFEGIKLYGENKPPERGPLRFRR